MGYITGYALDVIKGDETLIGKFIDECEAASCAIDEYGDTLDYCKWYNHAEDLKEFSKKHPDALFMLSGEGEESGDIWKRYFRNGKSQLCEAKIVFEDYDENKLV